MVALTPGSRRWVFPANNPQAISFVAGKLIKISIINHRADNGLPPVTNASG